MLEYTVERLREEGLVPVRDVARKLPPGPRGRPRRPGTVVGWIKRGLLVGVKLPECWYTSWPAVDAFLAGLTKAKQAPPKALSDAERKRRCDKALESMRKSAAAYR